MLFPPQNRQTKKTPSIPLFLIKFISSKEEEEKKSGSKFLHDEMSAAAAASSSSPRHDDLIYSTISNR